MHLALPLADGATLWGIEHSKFVVIDNTASRELAGLLHCYVLRLQCALLPPFPLALLDNRLSSPPAIVNLSEQVFSALSLIRPPPFQKGSRRAFGCLQESRCCLSDTDHRVS